MRSYEGWDVSTENSDASVGNTDRSIFNADGIIFSADESFIIARAKDARANSSFIINNTRTKNSDFVLS